MYATIREADINDNTRNEGLNDEAINFNSTIISRYTFPRIVERHRPPTIVFPFQSTKSTINLVS
jgi:hypothetical protein